MAVCSDGSCFENNKYLKSAERNLKRKQKQFSRKKKHSKNQKKARTKLSNAHHKVRNRRKDTIHKMTSSLTKTKQARIVIEDLNVSGMVKNHKLAKCISDAAFRETRRQLEYKSNWYGGELVIADRYYPSSKRCSNCGHVKSSLGLNERTYKCSKCGFELDRDLNAAINLKQYRWSSEIEACGDGSSANRNISVACLRSKN